MRVNQSNSAPVQGSDVSSTRQTAKAGDAPETRKGAPAKAPPGLDPAEASTATISAKGRELLQAKAIATSAPDVREDKIAELRQRIADKKYNIKPDAIADRMVDEHLNMSGMS